MENTSKTGQVKVGGQRSDPSQPPSRGSGAASKPGKKTVRVKSGCRTCKARKLKCDENRPVCTRCKTSGRICQGYGIWGGGNASSAINCLFNATPAGLLLPKAAVGASANEIGLLDWFRYHSTTNLHCAFGSKFWEVLTVRASLEEPAVFHAVLALSAVHKRFIARAGGKAKDVDRDDALLRVYQVQRSKAVSKLLEPQAPNGFAKAAIRTALITCMIFTNMDFTLGQYESGRTHFHNGIKLLGSLRSGLPVNPASPGSYQSDGNSDVDDAWIIEAFSHGNLSTAQFGVCYWKPEPVPITFCMPLPTLFESIHQAKNALDSLLSDTLKVMSHASGKPVFTDLEDHNVTIELAKLRSRIQRSLGSWHELFERLLSSFEKEISSLGQCILRMFHAMATIMADVCLTTNDVMAYDSHKHNFQLIIAYGQGVLRAVKDVQRKGLKALNPDQDFYAFVPDGGWQSPLFFTALHCRIRRLRLHAIRYLYGIPAQEFIWNHKIAADIGKEVMNIEHGIDGSSKEDDFSIVDVPSIEDLGDPDLPAERRIFNVRIALYDVPARVVLTYDKCSAEGGRETFARSYGLTQSVQSLSSRPTSCNKKISVSDRNPLQSSELRNAGNL